MKKILFLFFASALINACNKEGQKLPDGISNIEAVFSNASNGPNNSSSYLLTLNLLDKSGSFTLNIPASNFDETIACSVEIILSDENVVNLEAEIQNVRYKDCLGQAAIIGGANKQVSFSYFQEDQGIVFGLDTNRRCVQGVDEYYFSSSIDSLYKLFKTIIEAQEDVNILPPGWNL